MGAREEAKIKYGRAKNALPDPSGEQLLQMAVVEANLAVVEAVDELCSQVAYLSDVTEYPNKDDAQRSGKVY